MEEKIKELCESIGACFGEYFEENAQHHIDNGEENMHYSSREELLTDWVDTLVEQHISCNGAEGANWEKEVVFIFENVIGKYPKSIYPIRGKKGTTYKAEVYVADGSAHGKMLHLGNFKSVIGAINAVWKHQGYETTCVHPSVAPKAAKPKKPKAVTIS